MSIGLQNTKRRISSVTTTKKITKAMEMIATTKLQTWRERMLLTRAYSDALVGIIKKHINGEEIASHPLFQVNEEAPSTLYIVVSSNLGLCGPYNFNIYQKISHIVKPEDELIVFGSRGYRHLINAEALVNTQFNNLGVRINYEEIKLVTGYLLKAFIEKRFKSVEIIYTHFINSMTSVPETLRLLPLSQENTDAKEKNEYGPIIEPSPIEFIAEIAPFYINNVIYSKLIESQIAEQSLRRFAMEQASDNADELIDELLLQYNKERQSAITQEIAEIIGGSNNQ
ncbi:MAG: ATP synthase F1 subunit gamma [Firmicutes bacterium]|nr:ATP synthase F1 subunit gamma [Bacillota bacterium]